jgi:acetyl-CoA carboxylase beta subunit
VATLVRLAMTSNEASAERRYEMAEELGFWEACIHARQPGMRAPLARIGAPERVEQLADAGSFQEMFTGLMPGDPLGFKDLKSTRTV